MADDQPGLADDVSFCAREHLDEPVGGCARLLIFLHPVQVIRGRPEDDRGLFVFREGIGKSKRTANDLPFDCVLVLRGGSGQLLPIRGDRREAGCGGLCMSRIVVCGLLEFHGRFAERAVFQQ